MVSSYGHNQAEEGIENIQHDLIFVMLPYSLLHVQRLHIFYQKKKKKKKKIYIYMNSLMNKK